MAVWTRLELATPCVTGMYSNQLNYQTKMTSDLFYLSTPNIDLFSECDAKIMQVFLFAIEHLFFSNKMTDEAIKYAVFESVTNA